jgi:hypothetical protein
MVLGGVLHRYTFFQFITIRVGYTLKKFPTVNTKTFYDVEMKLKTAIFLATCRL